MRCDAIQVQTVQQLKEWRARLDAQERAKAEAKEQLYHPQSPGASHRIASQPLLSGVNKEKMKTNLGKKTALYPRPVSTAQRVPRKSSTRSVAQ